MRLFGRSSSEPLLTRQAREISAIIDSLNDVDQRRCADTIAGITIGIRNLGAMPDVVTDKLWTMLLTIVRKSIMPGAQTQTIMDEVDAGLSVNFRMLLKPATEKGGR